MTTSKNHNNYKEWFKPENYQALYNLPPVDFFKQIAIRDQCLGPNKDNSFLRKDTIENLLKGNVILPLDMELDLDKVSPSIKPLAFESAILVVRDAFYRLAEELNLPPFKVKSNHQHNIKPNDKLELLKEAPSSFTLFNKLFDGRFKNKRFDDLYNSPFYVEPITATVEVNLEEDTDKLLNQFKLFIDQEKKRYTDLDYQKIQRTNRGLLIGKLKAYKVIEVYDLLKVSSSLNFTLTQKDIAFYLFENWSDDDVRKKTIKHINMVFERDVYNRYVVGKN
jgi:hypothetical protein